MSSIFVICLYGTKSITQCIIVICLIIVIIKVSPINISNDSYSSSLAIPSEVDFSILARINIIYWHTICLRILVNRLVVVRHLSINAKQRKNKKIIRGISSSTRYAQVNMGTSKLLNISDKNLIKINTSRLPQTTISSINHPYLKNRMVKS